MGGMKTSFLETFLLQKYSRLVYILCSDCRRYLCCSCIAGSFRSTTAAGHSFLLHLGGQRWPGGVHCWPVTNAAACFALQGMCPLGIMLLWCHCRFTIAATGELAKSNAWGAFVASTGTGESGRANPWHSHLSKEADWKFVVGNW
jgi:hypothetical protein